MQLTRERKPQYRSIQHRPQRLYFVEYESSGEGPRRRHSTDCCGYMYAHFLTLLPEAPDNTATMVRSTRAGAPHGYSKPRPLRAKMGLATMHRERASQNAC